MKIINWFKNLFVKNEEKCRHNWVIITRHPFLYDSLNHTYTNIEINDSKKEDFPTVHNCIPYYWSIQVTDEVCIKCGKCYSGFQIMQKRNIKIKQKKELAQKLWNDGCKGVINEIPKN